MRSMKSKGDDDFSPRCLHKLLLVEETFLLDPDEPLYAFFGGRSAPWSLVSMVSKGTKTLSSKAEFTS